MQQSQLIVSLISQQTDCAYKISQQTDCAYKISQQTDCAYKNALLSRTTCQKTNAEKCTQRTEAILNLQATDIVCICVLPTCHDLSCL